MNAVITGEFVRRRPAEFAAGIADLDFLVLFGSLTASASPE